MSRSVDAVKLELRILRFMQLPFVALLAINMVLLVRLPVQELRAGASPAAGPQEGANPSVEPVTPEESPAAEQSEANSSPSASDTSSGAPRAEDGAAKGGTDAGRTNGKPAEAAWGKRTETSHQAAELRQIFAKLATRAEPAAEQPASARGREPQLLLLCPATNSSDIHYVLDEKDRVLRPGQSDQLSGRNSWTIQFHRGGEFGDAHYVLTAGTYEFTAGPQGWELIELKTNQPTKP